MCEAGCHSAGMVMAGDILRVRDRNPVPVRAERPRPERMTPARAECPARVVSGPGVVIICGQFAVCGPGSRGGRLG